MDSDIQKDEIIALENIYNNEEFSFERDENGCYHCIFKICIILPKIYYVILKDLRHSEEEPQKIQISHLPPLTLELTLPEDYPLNSAPKLTLHTWWLPQEALSKLCRKLDELWDENKGDQIMYIWSDFLKQETAAFLNIEECLKVDYIGKPIVEDIQLKNQDTEMKKNSVQNLHDSRAVCDPPTETNFIELLINYDKECGQTEFEKNFHNCKVCFTDMLGEKCIQFSPCRHIFCKDCISNYLQVKIKDGTVQNMCCPEVECISEITPGQIKSLTNSDLFNKYDSLLLNASLDTMSDIIYCPRMNCQYPVIIEEDGPSGLAQCPNCQLAFCAYCKAVYHGVEPCKINSADLHKLVNEYNEATTEVKLELEKRYSKKRLEAFIESVTSENWIHSNTKNCPQCNAPIEKSDGCNKITCWKCDAYFCWLCCKVLDNQDPYLHYKDPHSICYGMLHHAILNDDDSDDDDDGDSDDDNNE